MKSFLNISGTYLHYQIDGVLYEAAIVLIAGLSITLVPDSASQNQPICLLI